MKRTLALLGATLLAATSIQAQQRPGAEVRPFVAFGLTYGGDELESFDFSNGSTTTVKAGGLVDMRAGVDFVVSGAFSMQASLGYHFDSANGSNGDYTFSRVPFEFLGYYSVNERFRIGGGVRQSFDAQVDSSGVVGGLDSTFDAKTGFVIEGEYFPWQRFGIKFRAVTEKFEGKDGVYRGRSYDGSHAGVYGVYYFF
jgi:hypothetical protein